MPKITLLLTDGNKKEVAKKLGFKNAHSIHTWMLCVDDDPINALEGIRQK